MSIRRLAPAALIAVLLAASSIAATPAEAPYIIPVVLSQTGPLAFVGNGDAKTLKVFEDYANRQGGIRGQPLHFEFYDDQSSPQVAVQLSHTLIDKHPAAVMGTDNGSACGAMAPAFKDGPVMYCLVPSIAPPKGGYVFSAGADLNPFVTGMIRYMRLRGWFRLAVITAVGGSGTADDAATNDVLKLAENRNMQIVDWEHFNPSDLELTAQATHVKNSNAQAVLVWAAGSPFGTALRNLNDAGVTLPVETSNANEFSAQLAQYSSFYPKELVMPGPAYLVPDLPASSPIRPAVQDFFAAHRLANAKPDPGSAPYVWDSANIILSGLRKLGPSAAASDLRNYMLGLKNFGGIDGTYDFSRGDQHGLSEESVVMVSWNPATQDFFAVSGLRGIPLKNVR